MAKIDDALTNLLYIIILKRFVCLTGIYGPNMVLFDVGGLLGSCSDCMG